MRSHKGQLASLLPTWVVIISPGSTSAPSATNSSDRSTTILPSTSSGRRELRGKHPYYEALPVKEKEGFAVENPVKKPLTLSHQVSKVCSPCAARVVVDPAIKTDRIPTKRTISIPLNCN